MSLYYEAAAAITNEKGAGGSLKSRIYANKSSKHSPAQIYALVSETTKWSAILKEVIEKSGILSAEKKVSAAPRNHDSTADTGISSTMCLLYCLFTISYFLRKELQHPKITLFR